MSEATREGFWETFCKRESSWNKTFEKFEQVTDIVLECALQNV